MNSTAEQRDGALVPVISMRGDFPVSLSTRFGALTSLKRMSYSTLGLPERGSILEDARKLADSYGDTDITFGKFKDGDPRRFMSLETTKLAVRYGQIGIHVEVEINAEFRNEPDRAKRDRGELSPEIFDRWCSQFTRNLEAIASLYPETFFFIAYGDALTFRGRVTLNAFTPLLSVGTSELPNFVSPYQTHRNPERSSVRCIMLDSIAHEVLTASRLR